MPTDDAQARRNGTIGQHLLFLIAIPLLCLLVLSYNLLSTHVANQRDAATSALLVSLNLATGELVHRLQIERGSSAGFLSSQGRKFADVLPRYRNDSDTAQSALESYLAQNATKASSALKTQIERVRQTLANVEQTRQSIDRLAIKPPESAAFYTSTIAELIQLLAVSIESVRNPDVVKALFSLDALARAKESAGLERALTTQAFAGETVSSELFLKITERVNRQSAMFETFSSHTSPDLARRLSEVLNSTPSLTVNAFRERVRNRYFSGGHQAQPEDWFKASTDRIDLLYALANSLSASIREQAQQASANAKRGLWLTSSLAAIAVLLTVLAALWIAHRVTSPIRKLIEVAEQIDASDDFTQAIDLSGVAEVQRTAVAFNSVVAKFRHILTGLRHSSQALSSASRTLNEASKRLNQSAATGSDSTSAVAAAVEEASVSITETASSAKRVNTLAENSNAETTAALGLMSEMVSRVAELADRVSSSKNSLEQLETRSEKIGGIVSTIREIADQTNLLALNAAIEAARAGEHGRGFAVVADEVRKLAERTAQSTSSIADLIGGIKSGVDSTTQAMEQADAQLQISQRMVEQTEQALRGIGVKTSEVTEQVEDITNALREQEVAVQQIAVNVERIANVTEQNSDASRDNLNTVSELESLSNALDDVLKRYRI